MSCSPKSVLFSFKQTPPQYKSLISGKVELQNGVVALHSEAHIDFLDLTQRAFVRTGTNAFLIASTSGAIGRLVF